MRCMGTTAILRPLTFVLRRSSDDSVENRADSCGAVFPAPAGEAALRRRRFPPPPFARRPLRRPAPRFFSRAQVSRAFRGALRAERRPSFASARMAAQRCAAFSKIFFRTLFRVFHGVQRVFSQKITSVLWLKILPALRPACPRFAVVSPHIRQKARGAGFTRCLQSVFCVGYGVIIV